MTKPVQDSTLGFIRDTDGVPPGLDLELMGQDKTIVFSGFFYAEPEIPFQQFGRDVTIIFASKEVYVAFDKQTHNLYVVDRATSVSLGCRMKTTLLPAGYKFAPYKRASKPTFSRLNGPGIPLDTGCVWD